MAFPPFQPLLKASLAFAFLVGSYEQAGAVLFSGTTSTTYNTTAPAGATGWQYEGYFGSFLATIISPYHILTSKHGGVSNTFVYDTVFSGQDSVTYSVDSTVNDGVGYWDIPGTDMRMFQVAGGPAFEDYAKFYTKSELAKKFMIIGRGGPRGEEVYLSPDGLKGWKTTASDGIARWGMNTVESVLTNSTVGNLLVADFDRLDGIADEAHISVGDSGGAVFIMDNGVWKLAGINYGVEGYFDEDNIAGNGTEFSAALFDKGGYYKGSDATGWNYVANNSTDRPSEMYISRISTQAGYINNLVAANMPPAVPVPEPGGVLLLGAGGLLGLSRWRQRRR